MGSHALFFVCALEARSALLRELASAAQTSGSDFHCVMAARMRLILVVSIEAGRSN